MQTSSETAISRAIISRFFDKLTAHLSVDVAIAGAGPSGLVAACDLARSGLRVALFEKKLSPGGGLWGGGMLFNEIVVDDAGRTILAESGVATAPSTPGLFTACAIETTAALIYNARRAGAAIFNAVTVEDVIVRGGRMTGFVINWTPVGTSSLHVDPLCIEAKACIEATGHELAVAHVLVRKNDVRLNTETGGIIGERSMDADSAEAAVVEHTRECFPGLFVAGMAANACYGAPRMGPIFGGMLKSGRRAAELVLARLGRA